MSGKDRPSSGIGQRTQISTDKMRAINQPPTRIENEEMRLDPKLVIQSWSDSAEVMRDVAAAVRENQDDNENVRSVIVKNRKVLVCAGAVITLLQCVSVVMVLLTVTRMEGQMKVAMERQKEMAAQMQLEAERTRTEAALVRKEAQALTTAVAAVLDLSVTTAQASDEATVERVALEAEVAVAAAQAKIADSPRQKAAAKKKAQHALERAKEREGVIGPVSVDAALLEDL